MIFPHLLQFFAITFGASSHSPSLEEMAKAERPYELACGLDQALHVPSDAELKGLRQEAKEYQDNSSLRETWVVLEARKIVRKYLSKHSIESCEEAYPIRSEALDIAYGKVDAVMPLKRPKRFVEVMAAKQSQAHDQPSVPVASCDSAALRVAMVSLDSLKRSLKIKLDSLDAFSRQFADLTPSDSASVDRLKADAAKIQPHFSQCAVSVQALSNRCKTYPQTRQSGADR